MDDPAALAQAFKHKAAALRDVVRQHLRSAELRMGLEMLEMMPSDKMAASFYEYVAVPYASKIRAHDAAFFLNESTTPDHPMLTALRSAWGGLPADKQAAVWALLPLLCGLSKRYVDVAARA